jgi:hypothetical protein
MTYTWHPNQPNRNKEHFLLHFDYTSKMSFSNGEYGQVDICSQ